MNEQAVNTNQKLGSEKRQHFGILEAAVEPTLETLEDLAEGPFWAIGARLNAQK